MVTKKPPKELREPEVEYRHDVADLTEAEIDKWIERNKDALNASLDNARAAYARGEYSTLDEVMAKVRAVIKRTQKRA